MHPSHSIPESRLMSYSRGEITTLVMPNMQNVLGDLFGGNLMALVDQAAAVAAMRHAGGPRGDGVASTGSTSGSGFPSGRW